MSIADLHSVRYLIEGGSAKGLKKEHKAQKRRTAEVRQKYHDEEVAKIAREQNISEKEARRVLNERRKFEHHRQMRETGRFFV